MIAPMTVDTLPALVAFAFVTSITPGPNNLMLMASGANFGLRRTVPHMLGVALGFVFMAVLVGVGLAGGCFEPLHGLGRHFLHEKFQRQVALRFGLAGVGVQEQREVLRLELKARARA